MKDWNVHGSPLEYLRTDNVAIIGWWRCGDINEIHPSTLSGLLRDSSQHNFHLSFRNPPPNVLRAVSGLAPYSISGMEVHNDIFQWPPGGAGPACFVSDRNVRSSDTDPTVADIGYEGVGQDFPSGFCIMGWTKLANTAVNTSTERVIFGNWNPDGDGSTINDSFGITWIPNTNVLAFKLRFELATVFPGNTVVPIDNSADPFKPSIGEEFFWAATFKREQPEHLARYSTEGSGLMALYTGTTVSGLRKVSEQFVSGLNLNLNAQIREGQQTQIMFFGPSATFTTLSAKSSTLPPNCIMDEIAMIADGSIPVSHIEHYMNSGIQYIDTSNALSSNFTPQDVTDTDLVAYWTFDNDTGTNSSALGSKLDLYTNGGTFVDGIRGGRAIQPGNSKAPLVGNVLEAADKTSFIHVTAGSGLNHLFPDHTVSRGQTWIGWMKTGVVSTSQYGGAVGWFYDPAGGAQQQSLIMYTAMNHSTASDDRAQNLCIGGTSASGIFAFTGNTMSPIGVGINRAPIPGAWHLYALVFDIDEGSIYIVKDAKDIVWTTQRFSPASGISKALITDADTVGGSPGTEDGAIWIFANAFPSISNSECAFDDWAVFNRVLTLPEMSGFALNGVLIEQSPITTSHKRNLGFWKMGDVINPDNSGFRTSDASWYRHHLTNISGTASLTSALNTNIGSQALMITTSGTIINIPKTDHNANLDFSDTRILNSSGISVGCWINIPTTMDISSTHHIMGAWSQDQDLRSWQLVIENGAPLFRFVNHLGSINAITGFQQITKDTSTFLHAQVFPSGSQYRAQIYQGTDPTSQSIPEIVADASFSNFTRTQACDTSGFSIGNVENFQTGFASGTIFQGFYVIAGYFESESLRKLKNLGIFDQTLGTATVSTTDPLNISHWKFDNPGMQVVDRGKEQNTLNILNIDGHGIGVFNAIHNSGIVIRSQEYLDVLPQDATRLNLGSGAASWTILGWVKPPLTTSSTDFHYIINKGDPISGFTIFTPNSSQTLTSSASGAITNTFNGNFAPGEWNHFAIVYDRQNNEFTSIINGRYAGCNFNTLSGIPINTSGLAVGGRGNAQRDALTGGPAFSGMLDDLMIFERALTLPEISGLALNSYSYQESAGSVSGGLIGGWISGLVVDIVSGLIGSFLHGQAINSGLQGGYVSGISGAIDSVGGWIYGSATISGLPGSWIYGAGQVSGIFGSYIYGAGEVSGLIGSYVMAGFENLAEFDVILNFQVVQNKDFNARLAVELTRNKDFNAKISVFQLTFPPVCTLEIPIEVASGLPYTLAVSGIGAARDNKNVAGVRFTFADFKDSERGILVSGIPNSGYYRATRTFDTPGLYYVKIEVIDSYGYIASCARPFLVIPSGSVSGTFLDSLPTPTLNAVPLTGTTIQKIAFTQSVSGISNSGLFEYLDFSDYGQETMVASFEVPSHPYHTLGVREHEYTVLGLFSPVWALSGTFGIVSTTTTI